MYPRDIQVIVANPAFKDSYIPTPGKYIGIKLEFNDKTNIIEVFEYSRCKLEA